MADLQRIIEIVFQGTDEVGGSVVSVTRGLDAVAGKAQQITGPLASVADSVVKVDLAIAALGAAALGFAFNESVQFESSVLDLQKVFQDSEGSVDSYIPKIDDLASTYGVAATNVLEAGANFKQSGFDIEESLSLTDTALKAVKISELGADESSRILISTLRGFGAEASEAGRLLDILNGISNNYSATVGELGIGMADLSPIAKAAGLSFEETAGLLTPVIEIFGSGSEAANALKTSLLRIVSDTKSVVDALSALGVSQRDANGELLQAGEILKSLSAVWPGLTDAQQSYYAAELVGINQAPKFQAAIGNYETVLAATSLAFASAGSAQREWEVRMNASEEVINRAIVSFNQLLRVVGDQYRAEMTGAIAATGGLAAEFAKLVQGGGLEPLFAQLRPLLADIENDLIAVSNALPAAFAGLDLGPITDGFEAIGRAVSGLFRGADITTAEGLQSVLQDLVNIGGGFLQVTSGLVEGITPLLRGLADLGQEFGNVSPEAQQAGGYILGVGKAADILLGFVGPASGALETLGLGLQAVAASSALKTVLSLGDGLGGLATRLGAAGAAAGSVYFAFTEMSDAIDDFNQRNAEYQASVTRLTDVEDRRAQSLSDISGKLGIVIPNMGEFNRLADEGVIVFDKATGTWQRATVAIEDHGKAQLLTADEIERAVALEREFDAAVAQEAGNIAQADQALQSRNVTTKQANLFTTKLVDGVITYTQVLSNKTAKQKQDTAATADATSESEKYRLELEKIASNERIKNIEARVNLDTAELEAQTATVLAAFESIDNTVTSTGELLGDLFGTYAGADAWEQLAIGRQIDLENKRREEALKLQEALVNSQVRYLDEKTAALARGDAIINITGDGLEPELEAFMWRIIEKVQIRASDEGAEFLLGI